MKGLYVVDSSLHLPHVTTVFWIPLKVLSIMEGWPLKYSSIIVSIVFFSLLPSNVLPTLGVSSSYKLPNRYVINS